MADSSEFTLAVDIGGTTIKAGIVDKQGKIIEKRSENTPGAQDNTAFLNSLGSILDFLFSRHGLPSSVGIGSPGPLDIQKGKIISSANMPAIRDCNIVEFVQKKINNPNIPVHLDNDANCAGLGQLYFGMGRGHDNFAVFTLGTGVGGGLILEKNIFRGYNGNGFEIGHIPVLDTALMDLLQNKKLTIRRCGCSAMGCLETFSSAMAVSENYHSLLHAGSPPLGKSTEKLTAREIADLARGNDENAQLSYQIAGHALGLAITSVTHLLNLPLFILTGGMAGAGDLLKPHIQKVVQSRVFPVFKNRLEIVFTEGDADSGILGAAGLGHAIR